MIVAAPADAQETVDAAAPTSSTAGELPSVDPDGSRPEQSAPTPAPAEPSTHEETVAAPVAVPARPPYAMPLTLRPAIVPNVARFDNVLAVSDLGVAYVPMLTAIVRVLPDFGPLVRLAAATAVPSDGGDHTVFANPLLGAIYTPDVGFGLRPAFFAGATAPIGSGEGRRPAANDTQALAFGRRARMSLDNALFATNYTTLIAGAGLAWLYQGLIVQVDVTMLYGIGTRAPVDEPHDDSTNFVIASWLAYVIQPWITVGVELHHQHFADAPAAIRMANASMPDGPTQRYQTTLGGGVRFRIPIEGTIAFLPAVSFTRGLNGWMWRHDDNVFQLDLPIVF